MDPSIIQTLRTAPSENEISDTELGGALRQPGTVLLDGAGSGGESYLFRAPRHVLTCTEPDHVREILGQVDHFVENGLFAAGYLTYEAGYAFVGMSEDLRDMDGPLLWFGIYESPVVLDANRLDAGFAALAATSTPGSRPVLIPTTGSPPTCTDLTLQRSKEEYEEGVRGVRSLIREGDVYQVNYTGRLRGTLDGNAEDWYGDLRGRQPVSYGAFLQFGSHQIVSLSPEKFFDRDGKRIEMRPMKGTIDRGKTPEEDAWLARHLHFDEKNRSENLMIVDLIRNDLSRVCVPGSVQTADLYAVESYPTVHQMTSSVRGRLKEGVKNVAILEALFPSGSITGAPKKRAMRRIHELENSPRGVYCGSIGFFAPDERASFNVAIRTIVDRDGAVEMGSGGAIVWDSDPAEEHDECLLKASFLSSRSRTEAGTRLLESILWRDGVPLLDLHLRRLERAAKQLNYPFDRASMEREIRHVEQEIIRSIRKQQTAMSSSDKPGPANEHGFKIRLLLDCTGRVRTECDPLENSCDGILRIGFSKSRVHSADPFLRIKSTRRSVFNRARREVQLRGLDEVLLLNESGSVTEGTYYNVFVRHHDDWFTPPASDGLLAGIGRSEYMRIHPGVIERSISRDDVLDADEIILTNSVRGFRPARIHTR